MKPAKAIPIVLLALGASAQAEPRHLPEAANLSPAARRVIHQRMLHHGQEMAGLLWSVVLLDFDEAARAATAIATGGRPLDRNAPELEHLVYLFEQQDLLCNRALTLATAANRRDANAMQAAFKQVSETCVSCHAVYLNAPAAPTR